MGISNFWAIEYDGKITEAEFNNFCNYLKNCGKKPFIHCSFDVNYTSFVHYKYLRTNREDESVSRDGGFCIDNNAQSLHVLEFSDFKTELLCQIY